MNPGLYIHIPFCRSKCLYCDFYSITSVSLIPHFIEALKKEITYYKERFDCFDTVYIGGGTPSILSEKELSTIFNHIFKEMNILDSAEITVEVNPCDISLEKAKFLKKFANRISLGIQSFDNRILKFLGRRHSSDEAIRSFEYLRKAGFKNISIDLIYAIPGQSLREWIFTLKKAISLFPEHISCYELSIEKGTPLWKKALKRADEEERRTFFMETAQLLESNGYIHYEVSNFARGKEHVSKHNQKYWLYVPYLGLGPSAHSFDRRKRWWNVRSVKRYCELINRFGYATESFEVLSEEQIRIEKIFLGLRTYHGVEKKIIGNVPQDVLLQLQKEDLVRIKEDRIIPTKKGLVIADQISVYLL